ncbi:MAG: hypothetical protein KDA87_20540, partial [Planctomycetales bacterium]|nr:hypothetical protein [Planctomycetales bacterium]
FVAAMENWDEAKADAAVAGLARTASANRIFELFAKYGCRDFRSIGHKAIYVANSFRTLQCIGWHHAEPILRSLAYALLNHTGEPNPAENDLDADRPGREFAKLASKVRSDWEFGKPDDKATADLLGVLYGTSVTDATAAVVDVLNAGVSPQSVYDALLLGSGESLMRQPGIVGLHTVTTANAMHYLFQTAAESETRLFALLQNAAFLPMFHSAMQNRGSVADDRIVDLPAAVGANPQNSNLDAILANISADTPQAARQLLGYLDSQHSPEAFIQEARRLIFLKGSDSHDYKFSSAAMEDFYHVSPQWRNRFLATSVFHLKGSKHEDAGLAKRIQMAIS